MPARICPRCRTRVDERRAQGSPYCLSCGAPLGTPPPAASGKHAKGSALPWILGGIGVFVVVGIGGVVLLVIAVANAEPEKRTPSPDDPTSVPNLEVPTAAASVPSAKASATAGKVTGTGTAPILTAVRPPPTVVPPPSANPTSPIVLGAFPRARAQNEVDRVTATLAACKRPGDPTGSGSIRIDFEPDGRVGTLLQRPFAGTPSGSCISGKYLGIKIGAFNGTTQPITKTFTIGASGSSPF